MSDVFDAIVTNAKANQKINETDTVNADGVLVCGKCGIPKEKFVTAFGSEKKVPVMCECRKKEYEQEQEDFRINQRRALIWEFRNECFDNKAFFDRTFENDDGADSESIFVAKRYVKNFDKMMASGKGLLIYGGTGTGKTYISACIANALVDDFRRCKMTNFATISNILFKESDKQKYIDYLNSFDLLIIDDLGVERQSEYMCEIVYEIINGRAMAKKPLIITTNMTADELKQPTSITAGRIYSRIYELCLPFKMQGVDRRRSEMSKAFNEFADLLGLKK